MHNKNENDLEISGSQLVAYDKMIDWLSHFNNKMFVLTGYAGTGKTFLVSRVAETLDLSIAYATYTGKASTVLKKKLDTTGAKYSYINTIHSLIYKPSTDSDGSVNFVLKKSIDYDLIVIDEASMIGTRLFDDLSSFGVPILFVGDDAQLPPVADSKGIDLNKADARLTEIHRQSKNNPIIKFSADIREDNHIPFGRYADNVWKLNKNNPDDAKKINELIANYNVDTDIILCGYNSTRTALNRAVRSILGFTSNTPQEGDKVICLKNNKEFDIYNGSIGTLKSFTPNLETGYYSHDGEKVAYPIGEFTGNFDGNHVTAMCLEAQFLNNKSLSRQASHMDMNRDEGVYHNLLDFAYVISTFKGQGSEFKNVIVFEEKSKLWDQKKWNYTAVTRAIDNLYFISE